MKQWAGLLVGFTLTIHGAAYHCDVRETISWQTDMMICEPIDAVTGRSQGVMRFWREDPEGPPVRYLPPDQATRR